MKSEGFLLSARACVMTASLSSASTQDCTAGTGDPTQAVYPDLSWTQDPTADPASDPFAGPLSNPINDVTASSCDATSWTTPSSDPFGPAGSDNAPGVYYFQVAVYCQFDDGTGAPGADADCVDPLGLHHSNVASLTVPTVTSGSGGSGGSGSGGSGSGSGSGTSSSCSGLKGLAASQCRIALTYSHALTACQKKTGKLKTSCRKTATVTDHKQLALLKCQSKKGKAKAACIKKANATKS